MVLHATDRSRRHDEHESDEQYEIHLENVTKVKGVEVVNISLSYRAMEFTIPVGHFTFFIATHMDIHRQNEAE